ncbi:MAG: O-antigen ligase family protein [Anaerolineales bacterium]
MNDFSSSVKAYSEKLTSTEVWVISILALVSMVRSQLLPAVVITAAFFWLVRKVAYGCFSVRTPCDLNIIVLVLMLPVAVWITVLPEITTIQVLRVLVGIAMYYAIANWCSSYNRLRLTLMGVMAVGLTLAFFAFISVEWSSYKLPFIPIDLYKRFTVIVQDAVHPNVLAGNLILLVPFGMAYLLFGWRDINWLERFLAFIATLLISGIIFLTQSRGAWIAFGVVVIILLILRWRWGWLLLFTVVVGTIWLFNYFGSRELLNALTSSTTIGGIDERLEIWLRAIFMIQDFSFTGIGMGSFTEVADILYPFSSSPGRISHAHNLFLQVAVDLGIPGLIAWLAILLTVIFVSRQVYYAGKTSQNGLITGIGAALLCSQIALITHGLTDSVTWGMVRPAPLVWVIWGVAIASFNLIKGNRKVRR